MTVWAQTGTDLSVLEWIATGGMIPLLLMIVVGALKEWWVPGSTFRRALAERDEWQDLALRSLDLGADAVKVVEHAVTKK